MMVLLVFCDQCVVDRDEDNGEVDAE